MATSTEDMNVPEGFLVAPRVPQGLAAAVEGLTREVIRHRPEDIYVFAAHHFEKLLHMREQYGAYRSLSVDERNLQALRDMSEVLRRRDAFKEEKKPRDLVYHSGWSLNETARVLDRHRSIFGDEGRKISTEEVRELASAKEKRKSEHFGRHRTPEKRPSRRKEAYRETSGMRNGPRIISQIPTLPGSTVKDIKSELRKNRISSRERRNLRNQMTEMESEVLKSTSRRCLEKSEWSERRQMTEKRERTERSERSERKEERRRNSERRSSRGLSMDRVKDYVVQKFATTKSLEELQSPTYVEKVQEVIDETAPIIKEKVEELKNSLSSKRNFSKEHSKGQSKEISKSNELKDKSRSSELKESSKSSETKENSRSIKVKKRSHVSDLETPNDSLEDVETLKSEVESIGPKNALETRLSETQTLLEGISSSFTIPLRRSNSAKDLRHRLSEASNVSLPVVRPFSSKSYSMSVSRSDFDYLVLPLISPEVTKSTKANEELVLPVLSTIGSASNLEGKGQMKDTDEEEGNDKDVAGKRDRRDVRNGSDKEDIENKDKKEEQVKDDKERSDKEYNPEKMCSKGEEKLLGVKNDVPLTPKELGRVEAEVEEVFRDSLNVTPEPLDIPQRPDSLEPEEEVAAVRDGPSGLREQLLEIQNVEKEIESLLDPGYNEVVEEKGQVQFSIRDKLQEVEDSERRIDGILGEGKIELGLSIKESLKELEVVEKRMETFLDERIKMEISNTKDEVHRIETDLREEEKLAICETLENKNICVVEGKGGEEMVNSQKEKGRGEKIKEDKLEDQSKEREKKSEEEEQKSENTEEKIEKAENNLKEEEDEEDSSSSKKSIPFSYVLTEGSPCEIPDSVITVIIPDRIPTPDSDTLEIEVEEGEVRSKLIPAKSKNLNNGGEKNSEKEEDFLKSLEDSHPNLDVFGEVVRLDSSNSSLINIDLMNIKTGHDLMMPHQDLDQIKEEDDKDMAQIKQDEKHQKNKLEKIKEIKEESNQKEEAKKETNEEVNEVKEDIDEEELKVLKVMTAALKEEEEKQLKEKSKPQEGEESSPEVLRLSDSESTDETKETSITDGVLEVTDAVENSLEVEESTGRSIESTNEVKETTMTDQSNASFSLDPGMPIVPELNLDSLQDLTVSSFKMTDEETEKRESEETGSAVSITEPESEGKDEKMEEGGAESDDGRFKDKKQIKEEEGEESKEGKEENMMDGSENEGNEAKEDRKVNDEEKIKEVAVEMVKERKNDKELGKIEEGLKKEQEKQEEHDEIKERLEGIKRMEKQEDEIMKSIEATESMEKEEVKKNVEPQEELKRQMEVKEYFEVKNNLTDSKIKKRKEGTFTAVGKNEDKENDSLKEDSLVDTEKNNVRLVECEEIKEKKNLEAINGSADKEVKEEMVKEQVVVKEDICIKAKAYVTTLGGENEEEEGKKKAEVEERKKEKMEKVGESQEEMGNDQEQREVQKEGEIKNENEELSQISIKETLKEKVEEIQKEDSLLIESRSASQCTTRRLSSGNLELKEENLISNEGKVEGKEEVEDDLIIEKEEEWKVVTEEIAKAEVVTNAIKDDKLEKKTEYHIYVPKSMEDSSSDTSTFISAATKIQAGVRGFLTRRRLQSTQCRSSTLDSIPSIQESFVVESGTITESLLSPVEEVTQAATIIQSNYHQCNARKRLRREDAIQRTTLSLENAFSVNGLQHTGEFHDCVPLPVFELKRKDLIKKKSPGSSAEREKKVDSKEGYTIEEDKNRERNKEAGKDEKEGGNKSGGRDTYTGKDKTSRRDESIGSGEKDGSDRTEGKDKKEGIRENKERDEGTERDKSEEKDKQEEIIKNEGKDNGRDKTQEDDTKIGREKNETKGLNKAEEVKYHLGSQKSCTYPGMNYPQEEIHFPCDLPNGYRQSELGNIFLKQPAFHLGLNPKIGPVVDFLLSKEDPMLQNSYLNFITSVEDEINPLEIPKVESKNLGVENTSDSGSSISIREPLAIPGSPKGIVIEEVTSLEAVRSISGSIPPEEEDGVLGSEAAKEDNIVEGSELKRGMEKEHSFLESFEGERKGKGERGDENKVKGINEIEEGGKIRMYKEGRSKEGNDIENTDIRDEERNEENNVRESPGSLDDRELLKGSPISLYDPTSPETTRMSSAKWKKIKDIEEIRKPPLVNRKEEFREGSPLFSDTVGSFSKEEVSFNEKISSSENEGTLSNSKERQIISLDEENGVSCSNRKGISSVEEEIKSSFLSAKEYSSLNRESDSAFKKDNSSLKEEKRSLREESHSSSKEEKRFSLKEDKNFSSKEEGPASITNNKGPSSPENQSFKDDFPNLEDSSLVPDASLSSLSFSMNIEDVLGLGSEEESCKVFKKPNVLIRNIPGSFGSSQDSQNSEKCIGRLQSPVTMMQIVPNSMEDKSRSLEDDKVFETFNGVRDYKEERDDSKEENREGNEDKETENIKEMKFRELKERASPKSDSSSEKSSKERRKVLGK